MKVLLDMGNTRVKLGFYKNKETKSQGNQKMKTFSFSYHKIDLIRLAKHIESAETVYIATVSLKKLKTFFEIIFELKNYSKDFKILYSTLADNRDAISKLFEVPNDTKIEFINISPFLSFVSEAKGVGIDKLLSLEGAIKIKKEFLLVVLGTAITVDVCQNKIHTGGFITAGFHTQYNALLSNTDIDLSDLKIEYNTGLTLDTKGAVQNAVSSINLLGLRELLLELSVKYKLPDIIISGGDGKILYNFLNEKKEFENISIYEIENIALDGFADLIGKI